MAQIIEKNLNFELQKAKEFLISELAGLRVGRATPALVENVFVDYYGSKVPLKQIASISALDPKTLVIEPWDRGALSEIEKAVHASNLGLNPVVDKNIVRISIPQLTEERRNSLLKIINIKLEEAKIKCRTARDESMKKITDAFSEKEITEDEKFKLKEKIEKFISESVKNLETLAETKEKEMRE